MNFTVDHINEALVKAILARQDLWDREYESKAHGRGNCPKEREIVVAETAVAILNSLVDATKDD